MRRARLLGMCFGRVVGAGVERSAHSLYILGGEGVGGGLEAIAMGGLYIGGTRLCRELGCTLPMSFRIIRV